MSISYIKSLVKIMHNHKYLTEEMRVQLLKYAQIRFSYSLLFWNSHPIAMSYKQYLEHVLSGYFDIFVLHAHLHIDTYKESKPVQPVHNTPTRSLISLSLEAHLSNIAKCDPKAFENPEVIKDVIELYQMVGMDTASVEQDIQVAVFKHIQYIPERKCLFGYCNKMINGHSDSMCFGCCSKHDMSFRDRAFKHQCIVCGQNIRLSRNAMPHVEYNSPIDRLVICDNMNCKTSFAAKEKESYLVWIVKH